MNQVIQLRDRAVIKALDLLTEIIEEEGIPSTSDRLEACRILLNYDAQIYSANVDADDDEDESVNDEDDDGER